MRFSKKTWAIIALVIIAAVLIVAFGRGRDQQAQYFTAKVETGTIRAVVEATGTINAVTTVQVGSQVSGTISKLYADFNSKVKQGEVIARIDPSIFEGNLLQARADLENARANLAAAKANLEKSKATAIQMQAQYKRTQALTQEGVLSQQQLEVDRSNAESAQAQVSAAQAQVSQAAAQVSQKQAAVDVAETNLKHTVIVAPIDGTVVNRAVDVGQTVAASLQAPTLFTIAQDLTKMQVYTKTDESDIGRIRSGQEVTFTVDAFPNETFRGKVAQVRLNPTTVQNVVTYDTIIEFDNPDMKLFPGMTAYVTIPVGIAKDVLEVPNGALRFKPDMTPDEVRALYQKYGIHMGHGGRAGAQQTAESGNPGRGAHAAAAQGHPQRASTSGENDRNTEGTTQIVWKLLPDKTLKPVKVKLGITDLTNTAMLSGELQPGDELVTGSANFGGRSTNPLAMRRGR